MFKRLVISAMALGLLACSGGEVDEGKSSNSSSSSTSSSSSSSTASTSSSSTSSSSSSSSSSSGSGEKVADLARGKTIYETQCSFCHGKNGIPENDKQTHLNIEQYSKLLATKTIAETMPPQATSSCDEQCATDVVAYIFDAFVEDPYAVNCASGSRPVSKVPFRRLSAIEYNASVNRLLGTKGNHSSFIFTRDRAGFLSANGMLTDMAELTAYKLMATELANKGVDSAPLLQGVDLENSNAVQKFVSEFGLRAFRRPLVNEEINDYMKVYETTKKQDGGRQGVVWLLSTMLASPNFIYHIEKGDSSKKLPDGRVPLTTYEYAARLSFFLNNVLPDEVLIQAAAEGKLETEADIKLQVNRLLSNGFGGNRLANFVAEWLQIDSADPLKFEYLGKFDSAIARTPGDLRSSLKKTVKHIVNNGSGTLAEMFTTDSYMVNKSLGDSWGLSHSSTANNQWVSVSPGEKRRGLLAHPSVMAVYTSGDFANATLRGDLVHKHILCRAELDITQVDDGAFPVIENGGLPTSRQTLEQLHVGDACDKCHKKLDPLGFAFESYDNNGRYREMEQRGNHAPAPLDTSGVIIVDEQEYPYDDVIDYTQILAESVALQECANKHMFRYALLKKETMVDACSIQQLKNNLPETGATLKDLMTEIVLTDAFRYFNGVSIKDE